MNDTSNNTQRVVEVDEAALPLHCPMPRSHAWRAHPRVYLPVDATGDALCPYCGTLYRLKRQSTTSHH